MAQSDDPSSHAIRFCWGKKRGIGGAKRNIQFYESFMIDDVNYSLFDCVYLYETDALEPYIGKIVKIWEQPDHKKKLKILWFFRPNELQNYLGDHTPLEKEIFLATGEGVGLFNINPLIKLPKVLCCAQSREDREDVLVSANHVEENLNFGKSKSNTGLIDNKPSEKMRLIDMPIEAPNGTSLRKENFDSNDSGSQKKSTDALIEASSDSSSVKRKFELEGVGSSKEIVHMDKESFEKNDALDGMRFSKKMKPTDAPELLNDASSRKQNFESNGPNYFRETLHLTNSAHEKRSLIEKKTKPLDESPQETSSISIGNKEKTNYGVLEVTKRPDA
ncbi:hypothetical protein B296_00048865, partial [Ensete ventricosum]